MSASFRPEFRRASRAAAFARAGACFWNRAIILSGSKTKASAICSKAKCRVSIPFWLLRTLRRMARERVVSS